MLEVGKIARTDERRVNRLLPLVTDTKDLIQFVNKLVQVRKTTPSPEENERMDDSFYFEGQLVPGIVAVLTPRQAGKYVSRINELWGSNHKLRKMTKVTWFEEEFYFVLVAGHMRYDTALRLIDRWIKGEIDSLGRFDGQYYAELRFGLTAEEAIRIQIHENIRNQLHSADEIFAAWLFWEWKKLDGSGFTKKQLAEMFGRGTGWVTEALLFMDLPEAIQELAFPMKPGEKPQVIKSLLVEIARFIARYEEITETTLSEAAKWREVDSAVAENLTPEHFRAQAQQRIDHLTNGDGAQSALDFLEEFTDPLSSRPMRKVAGRSLLLSALNARSYLQSLRQIRERGGFGEGSPFDPAEPGEEAEYSIGSPVRLVGSLAAELAAEAAYFEALAAKWGKGRGRPLIADSRPGLDRSAEALKQLGDSEAAEKDP